MLQNEKEEKEHDKEKEKEKEYATSPAKEQGVIESPVNHTTSASPAISLGNRLLQAIDRGTQVASLLECVHGG